MAIDVVIDNIGRVFGLTIQSLKNHVAVYYGGVVQHQLNYVPLHTCTYFFFLWKSLDVRWKLNYPKKSTKGEKVQNSLPEA